MSFAQDLVFSERKIRLHRAGEARVIFRFDDHMLDIARRELRRGAEPVTLEPQVFDLLVYLVRNRGQVVTKDDLIDSVWSGRIVSDSALTTRLNAARRAVNDSGAEQRVIRTVPSRGGAFYQRGQRGGRALEGRCISRCRRAVGRTAPSTGTTRPFSNTRRPSRGRC